MRKRMLFIGMVVLVLSSSAFAGPFGWLFGWVFELPNPNGQTQVTYVKGVSGVVNQGTHSPPPRTLTGTQTSSQGTQSSTVVVGQSSSMTSSGPGSSGIIFSKVRVKAFQTQNH